MKAINVLVRVYARPGAVGARVGEKIVELPIIPRVGDTLQLLLRPGRLDCGMRVEQVHLSEGSLMAMCEIHEVCTGEEGSEQEDAVRWWEKEGFKFL